MFYLWDSAGSKIDDNYIEYYLEDMLFEEIDLDDVLVSILVTIAPRRIVIHENNPPPSKESVTMIRNVFQDRIVTCQGCERCGQLLAWRVFAPALTNTLVASKLTALSVNPLYCDRL